MTAAISNLTVAWALASVGHTRTSTIPHDRLACRIVLPCISYTYPSIEVGKEKKAVSLTAHGAPSEESQE